MQYCPVSALGLLQVCYYLRCYTTTEIVNVSASSFLVVVVVVGGGMLEIDFAICATNKSASELQYIRAYETEVPSTSYLRDRKIRRNDLHYTENMVHFKSRNASAI
jgi:hypothetical protein